MMEKEKQEAFQNTSIINKTSSVPNSIPPIISSFQLQTTSSPPSSDTSYHSFASRQASTPQGSSPSSSYTPTPQKPPRGVYISGKSPRGTIGSNTNEPQRSFSRPASQSAKPQSSIMQLLNDTSSASKQPPQMQQSPQNQTPPQVQERKTIQTVQTIQTNPIQKKVASNTPQPQPQQKSPNQMSISYMLNNS